MGDPVDDLAALWRWFGDHQFHGDSPLYERIAATVADDRDLLELLRSAPPATHLPLAPLAAARYLLLGGLEHPLGDVYRGRSDADPGPLFADLCRRHRSALLDVLEHRRVQTNDCGRSALIGPAISWVARRWSGPYCLVDVGASAGLNLLCDRYRLDYGGRGSTGPADAAVEVRCEVRGGDPPIAHHLPAIARRLGVDLAPVRVSDPAEARWLLACVWPDSDRIQRVEASIRLAQQDPPTLRQGRANVVLPSLFDELPVEETAIIVTTWAFGYFSTEERAAFGDLLRAESRRRRIAWISAENPGVVAGLDLPLDDDAAAHDVLGACLLDDGASSATVLARVHSHGNWLTWLAAP